MKNMLLFWVGFVFIVFAGAGCQSCNSRPKVSPLKQKLLNNLQNNMVKVAGGSFDMGEKNDGDADSKPAHGVTVSRFMMCKYEVTQDLYKAVMDTNPSEFAKCDSCPVEKVSWFDAQQFINKLNNLTGQQYRLPFEAEWEFAAKGGHFNSVYNFSGCEEIDSVGWNDGNSEKSTHSVGQKKPNALGLYDMTGNVLEWCNDWYYCDYYKTSPNKNPKGPAGGKTKVLRGCAWNIYTSHCAVTVRADLKPDSRYYNTGFRLVQDF